MVSLWPWKGKNTDGFEKTLSALSAKINDTQSRLDGMHKRSRQFKVLWTLYLGFAYLVCAIVLLLVVGYRNLGIYEWTGLAGGPLFIYLTRALISSYFAFRIDRLSTRLKDQQDERTKTIQQLKDATKYDSTMELIEKYGGETPKKEKKKQQQHQQQQQDKKASSRPSSTTTSPKRTNLPPPPTANIVRPQELRETRPPASDAEFAPNAFPPAPSVEPQYMTPEAHWYDRIFDVLLGEDETAAKNRYALICQSCRLVNGQAPPGTKSLSEVGMWRCFKCGATNGEVDEGQRIVEEVLAGSKESEPKEPAEDVLAGPKESEPKESVEEARDGQDGQST